VHLGRQCYAVNFRFPADPSNPYVYEHTTSDTVKLAERIEDLADASDEGHAMVIYVVTPDNYWPLPWYLRRFSRVGCWDNVDTWWSDCHGRLQASVLIITSEVPEEVQAYLDAHYHPQGIRSLRPEVFVNIYVRK
jgi:hypothetical protein